MKSKIKFIVSLLFGLIFVNAGLNKFLNYMPMPENLPEKMLKIMTAFSQISWLMPLVGVVEILGGLLFMIPKTRVLGALVIFPIMIGVLLTHIVAAPDGLSIAIILLLVNLWVIVENRYRYLSLIN
ncbi:DoxX family protein [Membranicola marinus]|uniref:DoxX family protein n=1 Tax=Membranihabitans marinus TaxID=1227546 RepID=A0A953HRH4_9BACT|nr:DoxX family protein [Membranihabitans marinus]MBY5957055.1 DoxX family protein [Membranihabitans marinus]